MNQNILRRMLLAIVCGLFSQAASGVAAEDYLVEEGQYAWGGGGLQGNASSVAGGWRSCDYSGRPPWTGGRGEGRCRSRRSVGRCVHHSGCGGRFFVLANALVGPLPDSQTIRPHKNRIRRSSRVVGHWFASGRCPTFAAAPRSSGVRGAMLTPHWLWSDRSLRAKLTRLSLLPSALAFPGDRG